MLYHETPFAGDKKVGTSILGSLEKKCIVAFAPKVPHWIETYHLTYLTIPISLCLVLFGFFAQWNISWLWGSSIMIALQWVTDSLDGAVGRLRNTGLIRWGYYMDHFLDYIFLCSILIGYSFIIPNGHFLYLLFFVLAVFGAFMVNSYLQFAATNEFKISYLGIGPTEVRLIFILINTLFIFFGKTYLAFSLPYILLFSLLGLILVVGKTGKYIWNMDMEHKKNGYGR